MSATDHTIQLQDLALGYPGHTLFEHVDLSFNRGELTALIGRNGTGKSTLLRTVMGLLKPLHGQILIGGDSVHTLSQREIAARISFVSTENVRASNLKVNNIVGLGRAPYTNWIGSLTDEDREIVQESLRLVGMEAFGEKNKWWLDDFALFMAVKGRFEGKPWIEWAEDIRLRWQPAMDYYRRELYFEVEYHKYLQFKFDQQWRRLKAYANSKGIRIIGDIPIYVALDSADAWANPGLFQLDKDNIPTAVAGVPPDGFSPTGQLWGNPLYRWEAHRATGYQWWITRLWYCFELYDVVRIDHFRGFDEYFSIPYGSETAAPGHWEKGPGIELFRAVEQALGKREIIAEDLGYMSDTVRQLVRDSGFPGMKVLESAFDSRDTGSASDYLPHNYPVNSVAYTGTHDNETLVSWYQTITGAERAMVRDYLFDYATPEEQLYKSMIALILRSAAATCIIPMQDWLGLDNSARINQPSTVGQNWRWRLKKPQLTKKLQKEICQLTTRYGRKNWA